MTDGLGMRARLLLVAIPALALVLSRATLTWFAAPAHLVLTLGAWLLLAIVLAVLLRGRALLAVAAALGGAALLRTVLLLGALWQQGPGGYWFGFWTDPDTRFVYLTLAFALFGWVLVAGAWALGRAIGRRRATAALVGASGVVLVVLGGLIGAIGLEAAMTVWNDQLALLPWGLSRILGLTVYLEIPAELPWLAAVFGAVLVVLAGLLAWRRPRSGPGATAEEAREVVAG